MMEIDIVVPKKVQAKTLRICCKVRDEFTAHVLDDAGMNLGGQNDGYVPGFMPEGGGDYLVLYIDLDTGAVTNWKKPTPDQIKAFVLGKDDDA